MNSSLKTGPDELLRLLTMIPFVDELTAPENLPAVQSFAGQVTHFFKG
jgi:hypothetical protein